MGASSRPHVLLVDDEEAITTNLAAVLQRSGFDVSTAADGMTALALVDENEPDLCVLDVMMPQLDGRDVLRRLRAAGNSTPVVLLTQVGESAERTMALEEGADDYLNKPFDPHELVARIRAVLRRVQTGVPSLASRERVRSGQLRFDRAAHRAWLGESELKLTPKALTLLEHLMTHPDELFTRDRLLEVLWGWDNPVGTRAVDNRVAELRRALGEDAGRPSWIETVAGQGYRFVGDVQAYE